MVVLTFLLAKAAYDRYNSGSEIDVDEHDGEGSRTAHDASGSLRGSLERAATSLSLSNGWESSGNHQSAGYPNQELRRSASGTRHPGLPRHGQTNGDNNNTLGKGKSLRRAQSDVSATVKRSNRARNGHGKSRPARKFLNMTETNAADMQPTRGGHFVVDKKAKALLLPLEGQRSAKKNGSSHSNHNVGSEGVGDPIAAAYADLGIPGDEKHPLSSAEMAKAMMGEMESSGRPDNSDHNNIDGKGENEATKIDTTNTTFRSDVRNEWADAVFGKDFFSLDHDTPSVGKMEKVDIGVRQGTGAAGIPHYVAYGAVLDATRAGGPPVQHPNPTTPNAKGGLQASIQSNVQSTPMIFSSPSSSSLLGGGGTLLASASLASLSPTACGELTGASGEEDPFATPANGKTNGVAAKYTVDPTPSGGGQFTPFSQQRPKLGITVSRIPLGLYVRSISLDSEAYTVGISPGSILVDVNGVGMLGERSDRALERIWRYAGLVGGDDSNNGAKRERAASAEDEEGPDGRNGSGSAASGPDLQVKKPIQLHLYKNGRTYTALLLSGRPLSGIEWAPCGNFALVHKVAAGSIAAGSGVRRGTLVVGVGREGLRTLDHAGVAGLLKEKFTRGDPITLSMGYTPAASRSGFHEKEEKNTSNSNPTASADGHVSDGKSNNTANSIRDVEVRSRPVEYSSAVVETFFACTGPGAMGAVDDGAGIPQPRKGIPPRSASSSSLAGMGRSTSGTAEVAGYVGAGGLLPPGGIPAAAARLAEARNGGSSSSRRTAPESGGRGFAPCPPVAPERLLSECWNPLSSLARSMAYAASGCCETAYLQNGGPFERLAAGDGGEAPCTPLECLEVIESIAGNARPSSGEVVAAEEVFDAHLLQLLGVAVSPSMAKVEEGRRLSEMLMDIVVDVALNDNNLCQRLFFLLRSFISSLEEQKLPHGVYISEESALATSLCRYAQRRLSGRMFDKSASMEEERHCSEGYPIQRESTGASKNERMSLDFSRLEIAASETIEADYPGLVPNLSSHSSVDDGENCDQNSAALGSNTDTNVVPKKKSKGKKLLRMLKPGKSIRGSKKASSDQSTAAPSTLDGGASTASGSVSRSKSNKSSFTLPHPFHKNQSASRLQTIEVATQPPTAETLGGPASSSISLSRKFDNMAFILRHLDNSTAAIEKNLMKSFSQKMADWALSPWSASKESALASVTSSFRSELNLMNHLPPNAESSVVEARFPVLNPVDPTELLTSVDAEECFILPSAHFPLLLCFNAEVHPGSPKSPSQRKRGGRGDVLYRTEVGILGLDSTLPPKAKEAFIVQGAVAGMIQESGVSDASRRSQYSSSYRWTTNNTLVFETRSNWGQPGALTLKLSTLTKQANGPDDSEARNGVTDLGCGFVDLDPLWKQAQEKSAGSSVDAVAKISLFDSVEEYDQHGFPESYGEVDMKLSLRVTTNIVSFEEEPRKQKRLLLYKHGDDLRQELLAIQFIERCSQILLASGLDLKLKTFSCQPVGSKTGFIEWVRGTVPLSELCKTSGSSHPGSNTGMDSRQGSRSNSESLPNTDIAEYAAAISGDQQQAANNMPSQSHRWFKYQSLPGLRQKMNGSAVENPIQDFLRSAAYDEDAPYLVKKDVLANYVKSCAGYCVITYLLGVGDRHLDNILLHQNGHLLHCDYSFILGQDPKTYLPMRITDEMIKGFGGRDSDNYAKFIFFTGAAFLTLRRHNNLHSLLSHVCNMIHANMGDVSINQPPEEAILAMRGRFRLDLNDDDALAYIEDVVEKSISSKMWRAVDVMHSLGKHF